jgi:hypothetical protein
MTVPEFTVLSSARKLPDIWDCGCSENPFLAQALLAILEKVNPCDQRYYLLETEDGVSVFVTYRHRLNICTYRAGHLRIPVTILGIPCSVSEPGLRITEQGMSRFTRALREISGGLIILNGSLLPVDRICGRGMTLPNCELEIAWPDFTTYLDRMRSHYRYKLRRAINCFQGVRTTVLSPKDQFDDKIYRLYEQVYNHSQYRLEKLPIAFFQQFPGIISLFSIEDTLLGFTHTMMQNRELFFVFGGLDYALNRKFHTYVNMLLHIIRTGMEQGVKLVNLGQTAEGIKTRLGCKLRPRYLYVRHSNALLNMVVRRSAGLFGYSSSTPGYHVFKD